MRDYKQHYEACKLKWLKNSSDVSTDISSLTLEQNTLEYSTAIFKSVVEQANVALDNDNLVVYNTFNKAIKDPRTLPAIKQLATQILPQIEQKYFNCFSNVEFIHCYENLHVSLEESSSWLWHYDNCPVPFIKIAFHISEATETSGCMKILVDRNKEPIKMKTNKISPSSTSNTPSRISYEHIESLKKIGYSEKSLIGKAGSSFIFSPNILHKATIPMYNTVHRKILMFYVRPTMSRHEDVFTKTRVIKRGVDVKRYDLD